MPIVGFGSADIASAHMRWAARYARNNNIPKAAAHFWRALAYERRTSFGAGEETEEIEQIRKKAQTVSEETEKFEENTRLLTVQNAQFVATYVEKIKKDPGHYDQSKEDTLDGVEWENSWNDVDDFAIEDKLPQKLTKGQKLPSKIKYQLGPKPVITKDQEKIAIEFEKEASKLGVLDKKQKETKLDFFNYRGAYVRALFTRIADKLQRHGRSAEIDKWREKKYEFHKYHKNPRGNKEGHLLTYPRKIPAPSGPGPSGLGIEVIDLSSDDEDDGSQTPKEHKNPKKQKKQKSPSPKSDTPERKTRILIVDLRAESN
jgi:hypothetical protein